MESAHLSRISVLALALTAMLALASLAVVAADAEPGESADDPIDLGQKWSYKVGFQFKGEQAASVTWDFGDGSEPAVGMQVEHTYEEKGSYIVTQTAVNDLGESVAYYHVEVMGFPTLTFDTTGGTPIETVTMSNYNVVAQPPEAPVKEGYLFDKWYVDADLTEEMNWKQPIKQPLTLYAGWVEFPPEREQYRITFDADGGEVPYTTWWSTEGAGMTLPDATKEGYELEGWYDGDTRVGGAGDSFVPESDMTLTAHWVEAAEPGGDKGDGTEEDDSLMLYLAIAFAVLAIACVVVAHCFFTYAVAGTVLFAILALVCGLIYGGII